MKTTTLLLLDVNQEFVKSGCTSVHAQDQLLYIEELFKFTKTNFDLQLHYSIWQSWFQDHYEARGYPKKQTRKQRMN